MTAPSPLEMSQSASVALPGRASMAMLPSPDRARTAVSLPDTLTRPSPVVASTAPSTPSRSMPPVAGGRRNAAGTVAGLDAAVARTQRDRAVHAGDADGAVAARGPDVCGLGHRDNQARTPRAEPVPAVCDRTFHLDGHAITVLAALNLDGRRSRRAGRVFFDHDHHFRPIPRLNLDGAVEGGQDDLGSAFDGESLLVALGDPPRISPGDDTAGKRHAQRQARQQEGAAGNHGLILREA